MNHLGHITRNGFGYIIANPALRFKRGGRLIHWEVDLETSAKVSLQIWRPTDTSKNSNNKFYLVYTTNWFSWGSSKAIRYCKRKFRVKVDTFVHVQVSDVLGYRYIDGNPIPVRAVPCKGRKPLQRLRTTLDIAVGSSVFFTSTALPGESPCGLPRFAAYVNQDGKFV